MIFTIFAKSSKMEDWSLVEQLYNSGMSITKICKQVENMYAKKVSDYLKSKGHTIVNIQNLHRIDDIKLFELYDSGRSLESIQKEFKCTWHFISRRFKLANKPIKNFQNERGVDESIFENIDTEEKAYWLGFLYADGAIHTKANIISLALKESDYKHVEAFKNFTGAKNIVEFRAKTKSCRFSFSSKKVKADLIKKGCPPKKSMMLIFPSSEQVPDHLIRHFIRGYFDGDGCLTRKKSVKGWKPVVNILGTISFLTAFVTKIEIKASVYAHKNVHEVKFNKTEMAITFLEYIYKDASIYLPRKFNKYTFFKNHDFAVPPQKWEGL